MARVLIVGCGCRGRELAAELVRQGHAVRGTTRDAGALRAIEDAGAEAAIADPDRLSTVLLQIEGVSVVCWLFGSAVGEPDAVAALHGPRLESLLERLVDTPVRGFVYEAGGPVDDRWLEQGAEAVRRAGSSHRIPVRVVGADPADRGGWLWAMAQAVTAVLAR